MRHESVINRILSKIIGIKIDIRENLRYETVKGSLDFADDDLPNWRAVKAINNPFIPIIELAANYVQEILAGNFITYIFIVGKTGTPSINIGLTNGGGEILPTMAVGSSLTIKPEQYFAIDGNLYLNISGGGSVNIYIYYYNNIL